MLSRKTKIVCSIGPASDNDETIRKMIIAGMNVARFNFSHGDHAWHKQAMDRVKRISAELNIPVAILMDTKGPEIRTGIVKDDKPIQIHLGDTITVTADDSECYESTNDKPGHVSLSWKELPNKIKKGVKILIADGLIELTVTNIDETGMVICEAGNTGTIGSKKNVNLIGLHAGLPIMSEKDKKDIKFSVEQNMDLIAASFVSFPEEIVQIRKYLEELGSNARIIAKIENEEGVENIDKIIKEADGIMVARGDLGVQIPTEKIPLVQKKVIWKCRQKGKPVITATQMLDSMIVNPRPTRAELTDVANAVFDGTDAVMLSGETAAGKYPVEAVSTMALITQTTENSEEYQERMTSTDNLFNTDNDIGNIVASSSYSLATNIRAAAIVTPTASGHTPRMLCKFRPKQTVIAITQNEQLRRQLLLSWGIVPIYCKFPDTTEDLLQTAVKLALDAKVVSMWDKIVMVAGIPIESPLMLNTIRIVLVGNVMARGSASTIFAPEHTRVHGRITKNTTLANAIAHEKEGLNKILVCDRITKKDIPLLKHITGFITKSGSDLSDQELLQINKNLVWVNNVPSALTNFESGFSITIDGEQGLIYEGIL